MSVGTRKPGSGRSQVAWKLLAVLALLLSACTAGPLTQTPPQSEPPKVGGPLGLPTIPWEGGGEYWNAFDAPREAGWTDDSFFPITLWFNAIMSNEEVQYDKKLGFNTYIGLDPSTPYELFADNDAYWIGGPLNDSFTADSKNWVGDFLGDEVDGRFDVDTGQQMMREASDLTEGTGRFRYTNYTQIVMAQYMKDKDTETYVNDYSDVVSIDMYWYTIPFCSQLPLQHAYLFTLTESNCRTSSSYGKTMQALRERDVVDGKLQRLWQFVEILNGGPGQDATYIEEISPGQLKGAVMNSLIHEARGIVYFNQSLSGDCLAGSVVRQSQVVEDYCGKKQVEAAGEINSLVHSLAPVLNSQSYVFDFGEGLDTMLKVKGDTAYVFSMLDDSHQTGERNFTVPEQLRGKPVEVIGENRTILPNADGTFTDTFEHEYTYHVYKVIL
ncbi:hypothetical protein KRR55_08785 [Paeniglutamicibacter sp. ABSL32-1]|uniref:hypothetical protein n=1 Tax=Paeniglutamicibacter quisquiliarum TaxID=2849498 RepID=UPI001C2D68CA|nr:hypothetical protein [Paeniglutamicibacter quisquiliarum]MBV1779207.1 hypothetical protein [Paeniglutamicibacter quisquiliarum]